MTNFDITNCRICLSSEDTIGTKRFSTVMNSSYEELLNYVLPDIVWSSDGFPSNICSKCIENLIICTNFKLFSVKSDMSRKKYVTEQNEKDNMIEEGIEENEDKPLDDVYIAEEFLDDNIEHYVNEIQNEVEEIQNELSKIKTEVSEIKEMEDINEEETSNDNKDGDNQETKDDEENDKDNDNQENKMEMSKIDHQESEEIKIDIYGTENLSNVGDGTENENESNDNFGYPKYEESFLDVTTPSSHSNEEKEMNIVTASNEKVELEKKRTEQVNEINDFNFYV